MFIIHKRKKSLEELNKVESNRISKIESNYTTYNQNNRKHFSLNKKADSPSDKNHKYTIKTIRTKSPQVDNQSHNKYSSNTFTHLHSKNQKNTEENKTKRKNDFFPKIKTELKNQNNLSEINIGNKRAIEKPFSLYNNLKNGQGNKKRNYMSININVENNYKYSFDEDSENNKYKNHQTKSTKISKTKTLQKERSQEDFRKRLYINSITPKKNQKSNYYTNNDKKKEETKNDYNNHKLYESTNLKKSNKNLNNKTNNINTNISTVFSNKLSSNKEKEKPKEKIEYKKPKITYSSESKNDNYDDSTNISNQASNTILDINPLETFGQKKDPIFLSAQIFTSYHSKFKPSTYSSDNEFNKNDFIKGYAYNSNEGNVRDYNEDTITATKVVLDPKDKSNYFYFFAVYDGHGGSGCSIYLKNNLYKNIKEPSVKGLKNAINETEKNFLENIAVVNGALADMSGSCAIMALIKNRKCIIANIGDSRCVLYKNKRVTFSTRDHKPNSTFEKTRIELAGGSVYQTQSVIPLFQNGKQIEIPWRVLPGGLSVSRTFGDIESKDSKFGGKKDVVAALPDIVEFELTDEYNFMVIGCDGIFDVLTNNEILECIQIVLRIHKNKNRKINELCGDFAQMIIKSALAKESFDNVSCIVVVFNINGLI